MERIFNYIPEVGDGVTSYENMPFLQIAKMRHDYILNNNYTYHQGSMVPKPTSDGGRYIDCSAYVTDVLIHYGYTEYANQWQKSSVYYMDPSNMREKGWIVKPATQAVAGDIMARPGHVEIYRGDGRSYSCGPYGMTVDTVPCNLGEYTYAITVMPPPLPQP